MSFLALAPSFKLISLSSFLLESGSRLSAQLPFHQAPSLLPPSQWASFLSSKSPGKDPTPQE